MAANTMKVIRIGNRDLGTGYIGVPSEMLDSGLAIDAMFVLGWLVGHQDKYQGSVSEATIAKTFHIGKNKAARIIDDLEDAGFSATRQERTTTGELRWFRLVTFDPDELARQLESDSLSGMIYDFLTKNDDGTYTRNLTPKQRRLPPRNRGGCHPETEAVATPKQRRHIDDHLIDQPNDQPNDQPGIPQMLLDLISMWNLIKGKGLANHGIDPNKPSNGLLKAFKQFSTQKKFADCREAFKDLDAVYKRLVAATRIHNEPYFRLDWLLTVAPNNGEFAAVKLMEGFYDGGTKAGTNGRSQGERGAGHGDAVRSPAARVRNRDYSGIVGEKV